MCGVRVVLYYCASDSAHNLLVGIMSDFNQINEKRPFSGPASISDLTNQIAMSDSFKNESEMLDVSCSSNLERSSQIFANLPDQMVHNASFSFSNSSLESINNTNVTERSSENNKSDFTCTVCNRKFSQKKSLKRHVISFHPNSGDEKKPLLHKCDMCDRQFSHQKNLAYHKRKQHMSDPDVKQNVICPVCYESMDKTKIMPHFADFHEINIETSELKFPNFDDFMIWMAETEKSTKSKFIKYGNSKRDNA